jgi:hypothetical protein
VNALSTFRVLVFPERRAARTLADQKPIRSRFELNRSEIDRLSSPAQPAPIHPLIARHRLKKAHPRPFSQEMGERRSLSHLLAPA